MDGKIKSRGPLELPCAPQSSVADGMSPSDEASRRSPSERYAEAVQPVLEDLRRAGFEVGAVRGLRLSRRPYPLAVPVLVKWLPKIVEPSVKEDIVRTLSVPWAKEAAPALITEFERMDDPSTHGRWAVGNALEVLASEAICDDLIRLATARHFGRARQMIVLGLGKVRSPSVIEVLTQLLHDDDVTGHAVVALGRQRAKAARCDIESFLGHPKAWIRAEAKRALARIEKGG